jgi:hypothetical protein
MSDDASPRYSAFWPVAIVLAAFLVSYIFQIAVVVSHRNAVNGEYKQAAQSLPKAQEARDRLVTLLTDVAKTAQKDPNAMQIVRLSLQNGILHEKQTAPASSDANTAPATP